MSPASPFAAALGILGGPRLVLLRVTYTLLLLVVSPLFAAPTAEDVALLQSLIETMDDHIDQGELDKALNIAQRARSLATRLHRREDLMGVLHSIGYIYADMGDFRTARKIYPQALQIAQELQLRDAQARLHLNLGGANGELGDNLAAVQHYSKSLGLYRQLHDRAGEASALNNIAVAYDNMGDSKKEMEYYQQALAISREIDDKENISLQLSNIGQVLRERGEYQKALGHLQSARDAALAAKALDDLPYILTQMAWVYHDQQQPEPGIPLVEEALQISQRRNMEKSEFKAHLLLARLMGQTSDTDDALQHLQTAEEIANRLNMELEMPEVLEVRSLVLEAAGKPAEALALYKQFHAETERILDVENDAQIQEIQARFDTESKAREIARLKEQRELNAARFDAQQSTQQLLIALLSTALLITAALLALYRNKHRANRLIAEKNRALSSALQEVNSLARRDPLTDLLNRRAFLELLDDETERQRRNHKPFVLAMVDIDHFKQLNDRYGHDCGDQALITFARLLRERLRTQDRICRWGGEEFLILLPETDAEAAQILAERLRLEIETLQIPCRDQLIRVTATLGLSTGSDAGIAGNVIRNADLALYHGKKSGRNQVVIFDQNLHELESHDTV